MGIHAASKYGRYCVLRAATDVPCVAAAYGVACDVACSPLLAGAQCFFPSRKRLYYNQTHVCHVVPATQQVIKVPCLPTSCRFKTQEGDTLKSIAAIFNISVKKLKRLNPGVANPLPAGKVTWCTAGSQWVQ